MMIRPRHAKRGALLALLGLLALAGHRLVASRDAPRSPEADARAFLARHCLECHGAKNPKGDLRLDTLPLDFAKDANRERWLTVLKRVQAGEMPPKGKPRPPAKDVQALSAWITQGVASADAARGRVVLRRLNRVEYENTLRDLLGITIDLDGLLPPDSSAHGFDNVGEALHTSSYLMERYLEAADRALDLAIANGPQPPLVKKRYSLKDTHHIKSTKERVIRKLDDGTVVLFSSSAWQAVTLTGFYPPDRGTYRFRISASGVQSAGKPVTYSIHAGLMLMAGKSHLVGYFDAPADKPRIVEFLDHMEPRNTIRLLPYGLASAQAVHKIGADDYKGSGLAVQWVEVEGPLHDTWPPASHQRLFGTLPREKMKGNRLEVVSKAPLADAQRILRDFARRAFRRPVSDAELAPYVGLVKSRLDRKATFEQAMRVGLKGVLVSPHFLFLRERPGKLDDFALASRLSYFLWSSMPDDELLALAEQKKLGQPEVLRKQVERLLASPKASAFTDNFVGQWLGLREIDATAPDHRLYPEYDAMLKASMLKETHLFFDELLKKDLSLTNFVASDFTFLNARLAKHYRLPGPEGWEMRKVKLPPGSKRGGVMTMASVLKVTANGTTTSPVVRGAWVLDRILGKPPAPPPPNVPAVEPDIRGAVTIRQQLAKHREVASCATCHAKIDPPGFALESYDVIGGWRDNYRVLGRGKPVLIDGRRMMYLEGPKVDPSDVMADGQKFRDIDELKQLLLKDRDQLARALATRVLVYATGGVPRLADQPEVEAIVRRLRPRDYGLRSLVHEIVQSRPFQHK